MKENNSKAAANANANRILDLVIDFILNGKPNDGGTFSNIGYIGTLVRVRKEENSSGTVKVVTSLDIVPWDADTEGTWAWDDTANLDREELETWLASTLDKCRERVVKEYASRVFESTDEIIRNLQYSQRQPHHCFSYYGITVNIDRVSSRTWLVRVYPSSPFKSFDLDRNTRGLYVFNLYDDDICKLQDWLKASIDEIYSLYY